MIRNFTRSASLVVVLLLGAPLAFAQCSRLTDSDCGFLLGGAKLLQGIGYGRADSTTPSAITNDGRIVGTYDDHAQVVAGFLYDHGVYASFSDPDQQNKTEADGINNNGHIVGSYDGYKNNSYGSFGFLKVGDVYTTLDNPAGQYTEARGINDSEVIVGDYGETPSGPQHGFVYINGSWTSVDYPGALGLTALTSINNKGNMVGYAQLASGLVGFFYSKGQFTTISYPGALNTTVWGVNDDDVVVGSSYDGHHVTAFKWAQGQFTIITLPGNPPTNPKGINGSGQIVGFVVQHN